MPNLAHPNLLNIAPYKPGQSKISGMEKVIKLSSNESPFGMPESAQKAAQAALTKAHRYPDPSASRLRETIAKRYRLNADQIVCGAGSDELLMLLAEGFATTGDEIICTKHGFSMYPICAHRVGATPVIVDEKALKADPVAIINAISKRTKLIYLANPNNPTGTYLSHDEIGQLLAAIPPEVLFVLDEAYAEYAENGLVADYESHLQLVEKHPNLVVTRTYSKIYGMGGMRLGWCYGSPMIVDALHRLRGPFNVSSVTQAAGIAAMEDMDFYNMSRAHNQEFLRFLGQKITEKGYKITPAIANFVLFDCETEAMMEKADRTLQESGIIIRRVDSYHLPTHLRVTVGSEEECILFANNLPEKND